MRVWLYEKLKKKGLSQAALARKIGATPHSLSAKFCGRQPFLYREVEAICEILDIENPREFDWVEKKSRCPNISIFPKSLGFLFRLFLRQGASGSCLAVFSRSAVTQYTGDGRSDRVIKKTERRNI